MGEPQSIVVTQPCVKTGIDFLGPLRVTERGNRYILVLRDYMSGWAETRATPNATSETTVEFLTTTMHRHGATIEIVSDQGPAFNAALYRFVTVHLITYVIKWTVTEDI